MKENEKIQTEKITRLILIAVILFIVPSFLFSQNKSFDEVDKRMLDIPEAMEQTSDLIAQYINNEFHNENDKVRAIFIWTAKNISYDIKNLYTEDKYKSKQKLIEETLQKREALCQGYATLFNDLAEKAGIKSYLISGYTKQNNKVKEVGHAWNIAKIDSQWFVFDPTWGAGHILNFTNYIKAIDNNYFKAEPKDIIKSHMPIDPLWQLLNYPISNQEFYSGEIAMDSSKSFFSFSDSISLFEKQTKLEQYRSSLRRIKERKIKNEVIKNHIEYLKIEVDYHHNHTNIEQFNLAIDNFNQGVRLYNEFIIYRSKKFKPRKANKKIQEMLNSAINNLNLARKQLINIPNTKIQLEESIIEVYKQIDELLLKSKEQQDFLDTYL